MKKGKILIFLLSIFMTIMFLTACDPGFWVDYNVVNDVGGTMSAITSDGVALDSGKGAIIGPNITFTALPDEGWKIKEWKREGEIIKDDNGLPYIEISYTVIAPKGKINVTVEFEIIIL